MLQWSGLPPVYGSAYARNGRGCRKVEPIGATVPRRNSHGWVRMGSERTKRPYTLHFYTLCSRLQLDESTNKLLIHSASHDAEVRVFSPRVYTTRWCICHLTYVVCGGRSFPAIITAASSSSFNPLYICCDCRRLGRSLLFLSFQAASLLVRAASICLVL